MSPFKQFIFDTYEFDVSSKTLSLHYAIDSACTFTETYVFHFEFAAYDQAALDRAIQNLFFMAGVSYYKAFLPKEISVKMGELDAASAQFLSKTWQRGLGEFFYLNELSPKTTIDFPTTTVQRKAVTTAQTEGLLVGIGGGKDSLVSVELLRNELETATWSLGHRSQLEPLTETIGLPHYYVERTWDDQLLAMNQAGAYNGHVPISAILACTGTIVAILAGKRDVVVSNEASADEPTLTYQGVNINHQYSKSSEFEADYQEQLKRDFGETQRYYSFLRPLSELRISELFAQVGLNKYSGVFSSCNRAFTHLQTEVSWCGNCPKCAFVFLALSPFVKREQLEVLFGKNLLQDPNLEPVYRQLLGIEGEKPLDCVGEIKESRMAMHLMQEHYPELSKYEFELPENYNFRAQKADRMPTELRRILVQKLQEL